MTEVVQYNTATGHLEAISDSMKPADAATYRDALASYDTETDHVYYTRETEEGSGYDGFHWDVPADETEES